MERTQTIQIGESIHNPAWSQRHNERPVYVAAGSCRDMSKELIGGDRDDVRTPAKRS